jgi:hypothetical protein
MGTVLNSAYKAGRHLAIWVVWQSTGTSLLTKPR